MKMQKEASPIIAAISRGKGTRHQAIATLQWRTFAADIMAVRLQKQ